MTNTSLLSYLFSLIGFAPINQTIKQRQPSDELEASCLYLKESTYVLHEKEELWLQNPTLCQLILTDYPHVAVDNMYIRHYVKNFHNKRKRQLSYKLTHSINLQEDVEELTLLKAQVEMVAHELDNLRPSEQFGRASEVSYQLYQLLHSIQLGIQSTSSYKPLFSLIILTKASLDCPTEVRQYLFSNVKLGRSIILELGKVLKNFNPFEQCHLVSQWYTLYPSDSWFDTLQFICTKLARYDVTWEYRTEYSQVIDMAHKYIK